MVYDTDDDVQRSLAHRYLGPEIGDLYLGAIADTVGRVARLTPTRWCTVDYTAFVQRVAGAEAGMPAMCRTSGLVKETR